MFAPQLLPSSRSVRARHDHQSWVCVDMDFGTRRRLLELIRSELAVSGVDLHL
jgi:hypothetical protein